MALELRINNTVIVNRVKKFSIIADHLLTNPDTDISKVEIIYQDKYTKPTIIWKASKNVEQIRTLDKNYDYPITNAKELGEFFKKARVAVICYGDVDFFYSRKGARDFYLDCFYNSDGCERDRYATVLGDLEPDDCYVAFDGNDDEYPYKK